MGKPLDWIDSFGRDFLPSIHTHLDQGGALKDLGDSSAVREILPWLQLSAELNPNDIRTYLVTSYWLRRRLGKAGEAEQFLRRGLEANPGSYEILFELGCLFDENHHDSARARNLWQVALRNCQQANQSKPEPDKFFLLEIVSHLAALEEREGNYEQALTLMESWKAVSPHPEAIQKQLNELRQKTPSVKANP